jgi:hypothetical protein
MGSIEIKNIGGSSGGGGSGDVTGPGSSTDNAIATWDGVGGDTLQSSGIIAVTGGTNSFAIGANSGLGTGVSNTAIGDGATTAAGNTAQNTAVGKGAAASGGECTAVGEVSQASGLRSAAFGRNAVASGDNSTAIGRSSSATVGSNTAIGNGAAASGGSGNFAMGKNCSVVGTAGNNTGIGNDISIPAAGNSNIAIGNSSTASAALSFAFGRQSTSAFNFSMAFGWLAATDTANQVVYGSGSAQVNYFVVGKGNTHTSPSEVVWRTTSGSGTNINGANFVCEPGRPTGSGNSGSFIIRTAPPGASGTALRTSVDRFTVDTNSNIFCGTSAALATNATEGFLHIPSCAGTPTGTPGTTKTGLIPLVVDTTNVKLYGYFAAAWNDLTGT